MYTSVQAEATFNRQINALLPYISIQQEREFKSKWATMNSRSDYENIMESLDKIAREKNGPLLKRYI